MLRWFRSRLLLLLLFLSFFLFWFVPRLVASFVLFRFLLLVLALAPPPSAAAAAAPPDGGWVSCAFLNFYAVLRLGIRLCKARSEEGRFRDVLGSGRACNLGINGFGVGWALRSYFVVSFGLCELRTLASRAPTT